MAQQFSASMAAGVPIFPLRFSTFGDRIARHEKFTETPTATSTITPTETPTQTPTVAPLTSGMPLSGVDTAASILPTAVSTLGIIVMLGVLVITKRFTRN